MSKYVIEYEDTPSSREDGVNYYKCKNVPYFSSSKTFIDRMTPYEKDAVFKDGMAQMYGYIHTLLAMRDDQRLSVFGTEWSYNALTGNSYWDFAKKIQEYMRSINDPQVGDVVEYHDSRCLVVSIDEEFYYLLNGKSFEVVCVDKSLKNEIIKTNDHKDLDRLSKALKGET